MEKSIFDISVPARTIYSKPIILKDEPVAPDEDGIICAITNAITAPKIPAIPTDAPNNNDPLAEIVSAPKLFIRPLIKRANKILMSTISVITARELA